MEIVVRASVVFFAIFLLTRGLKKRALAEMSPFEMLLLVTIGDMVQQAITQEDYSLTGAVLAAGTFGFWVTVITWLTWRSIRLRKVFEGVPIVLVQDGEPVESALRVEHMPFGEVLEAARQQGLEHLSDIRLAILEPSGKISIIRATHAPTSGKGGSSGDGQPVAEPVNPGVSAAG